MNENLRILMFQAGFAAPELAGRTQKFADLLIREISLLLRNNYPPDDLVPVEETIGCIEDYFGMTK